MSFQDLEAGTAIGSPNSRGFLSGKQQDPTQKAVASEIFPIKTAVSSYFQRLVNYTIGLGRTPKDTPEEQQPLLVVEHSRNQEEMLLSLDNNSKNHDNAFNEAIIEERKQQDIEEIRQQIGEVNEIFKDLAVLVHGQGNMIDDIGSHIENAHSATAQGSSQLAKAANTQRSNSSLTCLLLVIFGIVLLIVIVLLFA